MSYSYQGNRKKTFWLVIGISLLVFSIGVLIYTATNSACHNGPAVCGAKNWAAFLGLILGAIALLQLHLISRNIYDNSSNIPTNNKRHNLIVLGIIMICSSIALAIMGFNYDTIFNYTSSSYQNMHPMMMILSAIPISIAGIIITCFGIYHTVTSKKHPEKDHHPILITVFVIGIITIIVFML